MTRGRYNYGSAAVLIFAVFLHSTDAWGYYAYPKNDDITSKTAAEVTLATDPANDNTPSTTVSNVPKSTTPYIIVDNFVSKFITMKQAEIPWPFSAIFNSMKRSKRDISASSTSLYSDVSVLMNNILSKNEKNLSHLKQMSSPGKDYRPLVESLENETAEVKSVWNALNLELLKQDAEQNKEIPALVQKLHEIIIKDAVKSILSNEISFAEQQLKLLDDATCEKIVLKVYKEQGDQGLEFFLTVCNRIRDIETKIKVYDGLYNTMKTDSNTDARKLLRVFRAVMKEIHKTKGPIDPKTRSLIFDLWNEIQETGDESIYFAFLHED